MRILLVRPATPNDRFGLGPFFRTEPLGLEYVAAALLARGHEVEIADLRFERSLGRILGRYQPKLVGVECTHTVDVGPALDVARQASRAGAYTLLGGHAASAQPDALMREGVDAISVDDGEQLAAELADAVERGAAVDRLPGLWVRQRPGEGTDAFVRTAAPAGLVDLDLVAAPARHLVDRYRKQYLCVHKTRLFTLETARGCPYRCSFCSVWRRYDRALRLRSIEAVADDFERVGDNVFVVDDLFFHPRERSRELADELSRRGVKKGWSLVQSRLDTVAKNPALLEAWRPLSRQFDIFFGFEAPRDEQLAKLNKDASVEATVEGVRVARRFGYGVTGNFVIDPDWEQEDFEALWAMTERLGLDRVGFTILTPLPGTELFDQVQGRIVERDPARYDMHHILFEPRLGRERFFELFAQCWRNNVLSSRHSGRRWLGWLRELDLAGALTVAKVLYRTQRMMRPEPYLRESFALQRPAGFGLGPER